MGGYLWEGHIPLFLFDYGAFGNLEGGICAKKESIIVQTSVGSSPCDIFFCEIDF